MIGEESIIEQTNEMQAIIHETNQKDMLLSE